MLEDSRVCIISCIRQQVAQKLDKIHISLHARKFCGPTSGVGVV